MASTTPTITLSPLDQERFGFVSARVNDVTAENLPQVLDFCQAENVQFLVARVDVRALDTVHQLESAGFHLMDTLVHYRCDLTRYPLPPLELDPSITLRAATPDDAEIIGQIASAAFEGYQGHYHADPRLPQAQSDEVYRSWAMRSVTVEGVADYVIVAEIEGQIAGFATSRFNNPDEGEGVLFAVSPNWQRRGLYRTFIHNAMAWFLENGASAFVTSTQLTNLAVQKVWTRQGLSLEGAYYTFHKWFD